MPFLEKLADIAVSGRHVGDMSATFPAKKRKRMRTRTRTTLKTTTTMRKRWRFHTMLTM
jgi:hypothetical protein